MSDAHHRRRPAKAPAAKPAADDKVRLHVFMARAGVAARRKCEELVAAGHVRVNGRIVNELGSKVDPRHDRVTVDGRDVQMEKSTYVLLHKPRGTVTTAHDPEGRPTVLGLLGRDVGARVFSVGRLDFNTDGVLLLTNDGALAQALAHPRHGVEKTYHAKLRGTVADAALDRLRAGVTLDDGDRTAPARVEVLESDSKHTWLAITIREGKNRQIHRMGDAIGHPVIKLARVKYGPLTVEGLGPGRWRELHDAELRALRRLAKLDGPRQGSEAIPGGFEGPKPVAAKRRHKPRR